MGTLLITLALAGTSQAWAAKVQKTSHPPEIYSATESEITAPMAINPSARKLMNTPTPSHSTRNQAAGVAAPTQLAPVQAKATEERGAYDPVPSDQVDALTKRLQLTETLIRRHSRAYDYRVHTVRELEAILVQLDGPVAPKPATPAAAPAAKSAEAAAVPPGLPTPSEDDEVNGGEGARSDI
jgi:hypothetical protein